eukprot:Partr_v1_DN25239_c0_g1_i1_m16864 putative atp synthase
MLSRVRLVAGVSARSRSALPCLMSRSHFHQSSIRREEKKEEVSESTAAQNFINSIPGSDKTYNWYLGTTTAAYLFANEVIPYTPEVVYSIPFFTLTYLGITRMSPVMHSLMQQVVDEKQKFWDDSKAKAQVRLEEQIHEITGSGVTDLVQVTEDLFQHAEVVAKMEAEAYEHSQALEFHTKAKQILDEWVRYETNERERVQKIIADDVISKVMAGVNDPSFQAKYLEQCIGDIEVSLK